MSCDMLQTLVANITQNQSENNRILLEQLLQTATPRTSTAQSGNFAQCTARFHGASGNMDELEAFIETIEIYKECTNISDDHALRGLPMLLVGDAAVWWQGIKSSVNTWSDALFRLRGMYSRQLPAHRIFREIFSKEQTDERADIFVCRLRSLLAKLPYELPEETKLDIVYGLLNVKIRDRVPRDSVNGLEQLISKVRSVEEALVEVSAPHPLYTTTATPIIISPPPPPPTYINNADNVKPSTSYSTDNNSQKIIKRIRPKCIYCKIFGHTVEECLKKPKNKFTESGPVSQASKNTELHCYGCGQVGVIRSNCNKCKVAQNLKKPEFHTVLSYDNISTQPLIEIKVVGRYGLAILDTGATHSIASPMLYRILTDAGISFKTCSRTIGLADGSQQEHAALECEVAVWVKDQAILTTFMVLPNAETRTLLGRDFIMQAKILLDLPHNCWSFHSDPLHWYPFIINHDLTTHRDTDYAVHRIKTSPQHEPISSPPYRMSQSKKVILEQELEKLLEGDIIEECDSPWAANVVLVPKKDGSVRLCVDYRKLNAITEPDRYPLPRIEDVLHAAKSTSFMTTCDLRSGYFQVKLYPDDQDKTAFVTPLGTFRFKRMPMGLRNSGATFQRLMDRFKSSKELSKVSILTYLDDIIVLSESFSRHLEDLDAVFDRLELYNLRVNREKSKFACDSIKFLGHIIVPGGIAADPDKTRAMSTIASPKNIKQLKTFLQTSSWFRRFIPNYAEIARPLTNLLKKDSKWIWNPEQQNAFESIKQLLVSTPILRQADETKPFSLRTDSSSYCLGAVLMQGEDADERPVEYASRMLTNAEKTTIRLNGKLWRWCGP
ncbi:hypothetical protein K1T71_005272 [Dendrolimus kikuchii]|uniref:Uncharacterized protein n=1 Tax=Dendrolimus kikuchii TaxID=765133 RepID=A0ACC1D6W5_9NEOP|nr:hypothetical protein K1T71_005272 [Dendrolimus kikuchii]